MERVLVKRNVIFQQDRRVRLPEHLLGIKPGETNFDIYVKDDEIIIKKSVTQKENAYAQRKVRREKQ